MNIALVGKGKTGGTVPPLAMERGHAVTVFDSTHPPTESGLAGHDVAIVFVHGDVLRGLLDVFIGSRIPIVVGSTGWDPPAGLYERVHRTKTVWVWGKNFSPGMLFIREMIRVLSQAPGFYSDCSFSLHEVHHAGKKDGPSGTALAWRDWLGQPVEITFSREGDVVGEHALNLKASSESIHLTHIAHNRSLFARGALAVAERVHNGGIPEGFHKLEDIASLLLKEEHR